MLISRTIKPQTVNKSITISNTTSIPIVATLYNQPTQLTNTHLVANLFN